MKIDKYFGSYKKNNFILLKEYMSFLDNELNEYYNFGKPFFKGNYELNYGDFLNDKQLNKKSMNPKDVSLSRAYPSVFGMIFLQTLLQTL